MPCGKGKMTKKYIKKMLSKKPKLTKKSKSMPIMSVEIEVEKPKKRK